jgi:hypothetical protein
MRDEPFFDNFLILPPTEPRGLRNCILSPMGWTLRSLHGWAALWGSVLLTLTALTGVLYAVLRAWFGLDHEQIRFLLRIHQLSVIGIQRYYVPALFLFVLIQLISGLVMNLRKLRFGGFESLFQVSSIRSLHSSASLLVGSVVLFVMALTGAMYRINKSWLDRKVEARWWISTLANLYFQTLFGPGILSSRALWCS